MRTITTVGGNLFRIAADTLGDATQWNRIARLNGMSDPFFSGLRDLVLPDVDEDAGGGFAD